MFIVFPEGDFSNVKLKLNTIDTNVRETLFNSVVYSVMNKYTN